MISIKADPDFRGIIAPAILKKAALKAWEHEAAPGPFNITIVLTDDSRLQTLNRDYLGVDAPTDVLSFPADETDPETGRKYLGDLLLSVPRAEQQARAAGHPLEAEMQLLVVHGVLHLLGHDHADAREKARMWQAQGDVLKELGLGQIQVREE